MRRVLLLVLLALAVPLLASASSIDITNTGGTITGSTAGGLSLSGSVITVYGTITGSNLGSVTFTTPAFTSGTVTAGGMIGAGGTITITGNGSNGAPMGVIFTGAFTSAQWQVVGSNYVLLASIVSTSGTTTGVASELTVSGTLGEDGTIKLSSGDISLTTTSVPEPGTLGLLGTGLVGIGGLLRKRFLR